MHPVVFNCKNDIACTAPFSNVRSINQTAAPRTFNILENAITIFYMATLTVFRVFTLFVSHAAPYLDYNPDYLRDASIYNSRTLIGFLSILTAHSVNGFVKNISTRLDAPGSFAACLAFFIASVSSIPST
jgi:hypothetical protein